MSTPSIDKENRELTASAVGPIRDLQQVRAGTSAGLIELKEFLAKLKGRKPQDVIGIVSASMLVQSISIASLTVLGILVVFTIGPYIIYGPPQPKQAAPKHGTVAAGHEVNSSSLPPPTGETNSTVPAASIPNVEQASKAMGLDEAKPADPTKNPLDSPDLDKLLDGIDR